MHPRVSFDPSVVAYTRETVLTAEQVAAALQIGVRTLERLDVPCFFLGVRTRRYIWGAVLDFCERRSLPGVSVERVEHGPRRGRGEQAKSVERRR